MLHANITDAACKDCFIKHFLDTKSQFELSLLLCATVHLLLYGWDAGVMSLEAESNTTHDRRFHSEAVICFRQRFIPESCLIHNQPDLFQYCTSDLFHMTAQNVCTRIRFSGDSDMNKVHICFSPEKSWETT